VKSILEKVSSSSSR